MRLKKHIVIEGIIKCETGLHIGGSTEAMEIGGVDLPIIKHPISKEPYIPGSSLKGKMRSELEKKYNKTINGEPCGCGNIDCPICKIFGPHKNTKHTLGPTRILVRDCQLNNKSKEEYNKLLKEKGLDYIEKKTENIIDRMKGIALHPRTQERVPSGAEFNLDITLQVFDTDDENKMEEIISEGLSLVQKSYLGGSGSRGYGKIKFYSLKIDGQTWTGFN